MSVVANIISAVMKSVVGDKIGNELVNEVIGISLDEISEKGIKKIHGFINGEKAKIKHILSKENMVLINISEKNIDYVVEEIKDLLSEIEITDEVLRQCKYDSMNISVLLWNKYRECKNDHIECESDIKKGLFAVSEALIKLMYESEGFEKDFLVQVRNSVDNTNIEIQKISDYLEKNINKLDADNQKILNILQNMLDESHMTKMQENDNSTNKSISMFISYSWNDRTFVDEFDNKLQKCGYEIKRDIRDLDYKKSIKEFMKEIRETDYSIIVLSDSFLKSENCMREIFEFVKDEDFKDRIIPVILESAKDIWGANKGISYTLYWKERVEEFKEQLKQLDEESKGGYIEDLKYISSVKDSIGEIIKVFRDMKMFVESDRLADDISEYLKNDLNTNIYFYDGSKKSNVDIFTNYYFSVSYESMTYSIRSNSKKSCDISFFCERNISNYIRIYTTKISVKSIRKMKKRHIYCLGYLSGYCGGSIHRLCGTYVDKSEIFIADEKGFFIEDDFLSISNTRVCEKGIGGFSFLFIFKFFGVVHGNLLVAQLSLKNIDYESYLNGKSKEIIKFKNCFESVQQRITEKMID